MWVERANKRRFFNVTVSGRRLHLHLEPVGERLVAPGASAEWRDDGGASRRRVLRQDCVYRGVVTKIPNAVVALTNCDGLVCIGTRNVCCSCVHVIQMLQ